MDPERWKQIEQLCHAAWELEESQRSTFLKEACGTDEALRQEVDSLLAQQQKVEDFIEAPALEVVAKGLAKDPVSCPELSRPRPYHLHQVEKEFCRS